jgi:hypothetical protein
MAMHDLSMAMRVVADTLNRNSIAWALFGGIAARCYGVDCRIRDIDVLTSATLKSIAEILPDSVLADYGYCQARVVGGVEIWPSPLMLYAGAARYTVDFDAEMRRRVRPLAVAALGLRLPVLAPEDVIVIKALHQRGAEAGKHDMDDLRQLWKAQAGTIDRDYLARRARRAHGSDRVAAAIAGVATADLPR